MKNMWDERFSSEEYVYGKEPNEFFRDELKKYPAGKILLPAEGEGRNAVYAAKLGWEVYAFDSSKEAMKKAEKLAKEMNVSINYKIASFEEVDYPADYFDAIGLFYAHTDKREKYHKNLISFLKPGGILILEAFSKNQINYNSGGPKNIEMLFSVDELKSDFKDFSNLKVWEEEAVLNEGNYHSGKASLIRVIGKK